MTLASSPFDSIDQIDLLNKTLYFFFYRKYFFFFVINPYQIVVYMYDVSFVIWLDELSTQHRNEYL